MSEVNPSEEERVILEKETRAGYPPPHHNPRGEAPVAESRPCTWGVPPQSPRAARQRPAGVKPRPQPSAEAPCDLSTYRLADYCTALPPVHVDPERLRALAIALYTWVVGDELGVFAAEENLIAKSRDGTWDFCENETLDWLWCTSRQRRTPANERAETAGRLLGVGPRARADAPIAAMLPELTALVSSHLANTACGCADEEGLAAIGAATTHLLQAVTGTVTAWDLTMVKQIAFELSQTMAGLQLPELDERFGGPCGSGAPSVADGVNRASGRPGVDVGRTTARAEFGTQVLSLLADAAPPGGLDLGAFSRAVAVLRVAGGHEVAARPPIDRVAPGRVAPAK